MGLISRTGKSLIILLHGAPGVGKTATAGEQFSKECVRSDSITNVWIECAAKANGKPLLHIVNSEGTLSCRKSHADILLDDLFLRPDQFEADLRSKFRLAQRWDCVLLLDEADVFLAQRITSDLRRNYLVAGEHDSGVESKRN